MSQTTTKTRLGYESIYPNFKRKKSNKTAETQANDLKKQLGKYAALGAATAMAAVVPMKDVSGQIIYNMGIPMGAASTCANAILLNTGSVATTNNPTTDTLGIDIDGGGGIDFIINPQASVSINTSGNRLLTHTFYIQALGVGNGVLTNAAVVSNMPNGAIVSAGGGFTNGNSPIASALLLNNVNTLTGGIASNTSGPFAVGLGVNTGVAAGNGTSTGYVGIQFDIGGNKHFGWVQLELTNTFAFPAHGNGPAMTAQSCITIIDYAYESTPNTPITVGATMSPPTPGGGGASIPTVSEWGMMTLVLLMMSFGTLLVYRREEELATGTMSSSWKHAWQHPIFDWAIYQKAFMGTAALAAVLSAISLATTETITAVDMIGASIAGPIFAYLAHLMLLFTNKEK